MPSAAVLAFVHRHRPVSRIVWDPTPTDMDTDSTASLCGWQWPHTAAPVPGEPGLYRCTECRAEGRDPITKDGDPQ